MKIGVWLNPDYKPTEGGGYSYYDRLINGIDNYAFSEGLDVCFITTSPTPPDLHRPVIQLPFSYSPSLREKIECRMPLLRRRAKKRIAAHIDALRNESYIRSLKENNIRIIFHPAPCTYYLPDFPFITTHWDIGHRSTFAFPEVSVESTFYGRESFYNDVLPKALLILAESEAGKKELIEYTHLNPDRIKTVPIFAGSCATQHADTKLQQATLQQFRIEKNRYFYYPAQFWAHKNHNTLLHAFALLKKEFPGYKLVFSGSDQGNLSYIKEVAQELGLNEDVVFAGFISTEEVNTLYRNATAMVMPTLMGPTNMPPLEAMEIGCPVICSDLPGHREELDEAAIYINPLDVEDIYNAMRILIADRDDYCRKTEIQRGKTVFRIENALEAINAHLLYATSIRDCWQ